MGLKRRLRELRESNQPVFLSGPDGCGKWIWAEFLCNASGGLQSYNNGDDFRKMLPLRSNIYIGEICDLSLAQQLQLAQAMSLSDPDPKYRFVVASGFDREQLQKSNQIDPDIARMWSGAIVIPPLDEHIEDISELLEYYVNWFSDLEKLPYRHFGVAAQNLLRNHHWSGDITQLKQFVRTILANSESEQIELHEIEQTLQLVTTAAEMQAGNKMQITIDMGLDLREARESFEREYLSRHLALSGNNMTELARRVGQERTHLYRKLKSLGLHPKKQ